MNKPFSLKYLMCSTEESHRFGTTWVNHARIKILGWTLPWAFTFKMFVRVTRVMKAIQHSTYDGWHETFMFFHKALGRKIAVWAGFKRQIGSQRSLETFTCRSPFRHCDAPSHSPRGSAVETEKKWQNSDRLSGRSLVAVRREELPLHRDRLKLSPPDRPCLSYHISQPSSKVTQATKPWFLYQQGWNSPKSPEPFKATSVCSLRK